LFAGLLVLPEEVIENGAILLVDALHLVDVLGHLFHALECLCFLCGNSIYTNHNGLNAPCIHTAKMHMLIGPGVG